MKRRTALLILLLILTVIPTVMFMVGFLLITSFVLSNSGNVQILRHNDSLEFWGARGAVTVSSFSFFIGSLISCIVFFVALFLLIRDLLAQRRRKQKMRESYTV